MKVFKRVLLGVVLSFTFMFALVSCSGSRVTMAYANTINNSAKNKNYVTVETVKKDFGEECNDWTLGGNGYIFAVKGYENLENEASFMKLVAGGDENTKYEVILVYCENNNCLSAQYFEGTGSEISQKLVDAIKL